ncbi:MAG: DUF4118 domain-containing protein [Thiothrix sp.]|uniref:DUF4118 domain-containing protein n=1 Tax=Thiothrix sp. TaxID=1032 RepID=UPI0026355D73|nr:DUF4118 domain-containing protein [Thiothrix sp.]MDD5394127.1 DUF4118 domain-containing protein [Thiothrix sp.]
MKDVFPALSGFAWLPPKALWQRHLLALAAVAVTILLAMPLHNHLDLANTAMLFLLTVVLVAVKLGRRPAILTALCSVAAFNFFFVPPHYSFTVSHIQYLVTFTVMLVVALIITHLTAGLRKQAEDATSREQQTMSLYQLEKVAQETRLQIASERLRSSILSALSHDIRTPLTSLYSLAESLSLLRPPLSPQAQELVTAIRDQSLHLNSMVSNLLEMARLQAGGMKFRKEWQPLEEVIGASTKLFRLALQHHRVVVSLPADLPLLEFDATLMERVFCNLLENAAKYSPIGSTLQITAKLLPTQVEICVCNPGEGFPADKLNQVFELFERGNSESNIPGVGLGLSICRAIIEAHDGDISASNPTHGGGCVCFHLPLGIPPIIETEPFPQQVMAHEHTN